MSDTPPYKAMTYRETDMSSSARVPYTRPGRIWTDDEVEKLSHDVFSDWSVEFGELEELMSDDLRAVVMSYF